MNGFRYVVACRNEYWSTHTYRGLVDDEEPINKKRNERQLSDVSMSKCLCDRDGPTYSRANGFPQGRPGRAQPTSLCLWLPQTALCVVRGQAAGHSWKDLPRCNTGQSQTHKGLQGRKEPLLLCSLRWRPKCWNLSDVALAFVPLHGTAATQGLMLLAPLAAYPTPHDPSRNLPSAQLVGCEATTMTDIQLDVFPEEEKTERKTGVDLTNRARRTQLTSVFPFPQLFSILTTRRPHI
ncbi:hypothetical protein BDP81DRAFT_451293 [Colletotrichum phormii]|uniref:Uncharacterized protein n=1 Tax=Colletotrichum phormii TaxID=359342 RepID=A0AAJ0ECI2_9PEZI|nr:uncharacterized protein BDP81DRAFT_451293 [Colletotrichum phormii]KAK1634792.1 hypothetical protein BDP81DRAFT_451293 [Colletotrichum phormii]